ncbi:hypothetical protein ABEP42_27210 [Priestia megaterium]|uniref:hypothetical protein n=1 Tax=Priestia megaterium TaxID=1404 RepID=UPI003176A303
MEIYNLREHLTYIARECETESAYVADKFAVLVSRYCEGKECKQIATNSFFDDNTKVVIVGSNKLEVASFKQYTEKLPGQRATIDLNVEVIPYNKVQKITKTYHKLGLNEGVHVFSATIMLDNGQTLEISPVKVPDSTSEEQYVSDSGDNADFRLYLTDLIDEIESKI